MFLFGLRDIEHLRRVLTVVLLYAVALFLCLLLFPPGPFYAISAALTLQSAGAIVFDYGNNLRAMAREAGVSDAFAYPGFVPAYIRPQFCEGRGPFRWATLSTRRPPSAR